MKIEFTIHENDFLEFQLFTASKSDRVNRKKNRGRIFLTIGLLIISWFYYNSQNTSLTIYFAVISIIAGMFYPKYFIWRYKKHFKKFINSNYANQFGEMESLEFQDNQILSKDKTGEGNFKSSEIEKVDETAKHFFMKISTGLSIIIPKTDIENIDALRNKFVSMGIVLNNETEWVWK